LKDLTIKEFLKDLILLTVISWFVLNMYYFLRDPEFIKNYQTSIRSYMQHYHLNFIQYIFLMEIIAPLPRIIYCTCFFHLVFKKILLREPFKKTFMWFFILIIYFFLINIFQAIIQAGNVFTLKRYVQIAMAGFPEYTAIALLYSTIKGLTWFRLQKAKSEKELLSSSLAQLRSNIDPHFIFNSLNSVYALSLNENAIKTSESIEEFSSLFWYSLKYYDSEKVPVQNELEFIEKYIHLHTLRLSTKEHVKVISSIKWDKRPAVIPPLTLIDFVENGFRAMSENTPSLIDIHLSIENYHLRLIIKNSKHLNNLDGNKFDLKRQYDRLKLLYHDRFTLEQKEDNTMQETILDINLV